jgi:hypothetical protein
MKKLLAFSLITAFSLSANVMAESRYSPDIDAVCKVEIKGNNSDYSSLEKIKFTEEFKVPEYGRKRMIFKLMRLYPDYYLNPEDLSDDTVNTESLDDNQVAIMLRNTGNIQGAIEEGLDPNNYVNDEITSKIWISVRNNSSNNSISVDITSLRGTLKNKKFSFKKGKTKEIKMEVPVKYDYKDYELKGFLGIPSLFEDGNEKYEKKAKTKVTDGKVVLKCNFNKAKNSEEAKEVQEQKRTRQQPRRAGARRET